MKIEVISGEADATDIKNISGIIRRYTKPVNCFIGGRAYAFFDGGSCRITLTPPIGDKSEPKKYFIKFKILK